MPRKNKKNKKEIKQSLNKSEDILLVDAKIRTIMGLKNNPDGIPDSDVSGLENIDVSELDDLLHRYKDQTGLDWREDLNISTMTDELEDMTGETKDAFSKSPDSTVDKLIALDAKIRKTEEGSKDYDKIKKEFQQASGYDWYKGMTPDVISDNLEMMKVLKEEIDKRNIEVDVVTGEGVATSIEKKIDEEIVLVDDEIKPQATKLSKKALSMVREQILKEKFEKKKKEKASNITEKISKASSFDELASLVNTEQISIQGSGELFDYEMLNNVVNKIRTREWTLDTATNSDGFRDKLSELLKTDSDIKTLKNILDDVNSKLMTESYVQGASTDDPRNKRRDEILRWKSRLEQDIQSIEEELDGSKDDSSKKYNLPKKPKKVFSSREANNFDQDGRPIFDKDGEVSLTAKKIKDRVLRENKKKSQIDNVEEDPSRAVVKKETAVVPKFEDGSKEIENADFEMIEDEPNSFEDLRATQYYIIKAQSIRDSFRNNPGLANSIDRTKVEADYTQFKKEMENNSENEDQTVANKKKNAETLAYFEVTLEIADNPSVEQIEGGESLELQNIELNTSDIENAFNENPELMAELKALLVGSAGGGSESLREAIQQVLENHFGNFLIGAQFESIKGQLAEISRSTTEQIVKLYNDSLDIRAREEVGFFKKMISKVTGKRIKMMAATVVAGIGGAALAGFVLPAGLIAGGAIAMGGRFAGRTVVSGLMRRFGKKNMQEERDVLEKKEEKNIDAAKAKIINKGLKIKDKEGSKRVDFIDVETLACSVRNAVRMETNNKFQEQGNIMDAEGHLDNEAAKVLFDNIHDTVYNNTAKRLEIEYNLRQKLLSQDKNYDELSKEDRDQELEKALAQEERFLFTKYSMELTGKLEMEDMMDKTKAESGAMKVVKTVQTAMSGNIVELGRQRTGSIKEEVVHVVGAGVVGGVLYEAYQHSSILASVATGATGAVMAHEYGKSQEQKAIGEAYRDEMRLILADAEVQLRNAISGDEDNWGQVEVAAKKIQGLLSITRPRMDANSPLENFIDDPRLRNAGTDFLDEYNIARLESGEVKSMTPEERFEETMAALQTQLTITREDVIGHVDARVAEVAKNRKKITALWTALGAAGGMLAGMALRGAFSKEDVPTDESGQTSPIEEDGNLDKVKPGQTSPIEEDGNTSEFKPIIKDSIWNTIEENIKQSPAYQATVEYILKENGVDFNSLSPEELADLDLDKFGLGTTVIDKLKDTLVKSFADADGESSYIQEGLSDAEIKSLGFDDLTKFNPNEMTAEQMAAIDWEKVLEGDKGLNIAEVAKAMQENNNTEALKHIISHNEALQDLASKGEIDWNEDFDTKAEEYEVWQKDNPKGLVEDYLKDLKEAAIQASKENLEKSLVEAGSVIFKASTEGYTVIGSNDYFELNSDVEPLGVGSNLGHQVNYFEHDGKLYAVGDVNDDGILDLYQADNTKELLSNIQKDSSIDMGNTDADRMGYMLESGLSTHDQILDKIAILNENGNDTTLADVQGSIYTRGLESLVESKADSVKFESFFSEVMNLDDVESKAFALWIESEGPISEVLQDSPIEKIVDLHKEFSQLANNVTMPSTEEWAPRNVAIYDNGENAIFMTKLSADGQFIETKGVNFVGNYADGKIPVDEFKEMMNKAAGIETSNVENTQVSAENSGDDIFANEKLDTDNKAGGNENDQDQEKELKPDEDISDTETSVATPSELDIKLGGWAESFMNDQDMVKDLSEYTKLGESVVKDHLGKLVSSPELFHHPYNMFDETKIIAAALIKVIPPEDLKAMPGIEELSKLLNESKLN